jgi:hypothetical protein
MIWQDILIERSVSDDELSAALSEAFAVREAAIALIDPDDTLNADQIAIIGERWPVEGDFAIHMHVILRTEDVIATTKDIDDVTIVGRIAQALKTACFIGDDNINPATGLLIRSPYEIQPARIDLQAEDEGIYRLVSVAAHVN